jgi:hypothetical protein
MSEDKKLRVDFGCGPNPREGFKGVDQYAFDGKVDIVGDVTDPTFWGVHFERDSIEEAHASHFVEHLTAPQRIVFMNGLWRSMKPGAQLTMITPHWASSRAYGDPTHQWPPISEWFFHYLDKDWRASNAPHTDVENWPHGYECDFTASFGYNLHPALHARNQEFQQMAVSFFKEAALDTHATLTCRKAG